MLHGFRGVILFTLAPVYAARLQSMRLLGVGHDSVTSLSLFTTMHWRRKWQPTPVFLPGESQGRGSLVGCCLGIRRVGHDWIDLAAAACFPDSSVGKESDCNVGDLGWEDPLEKGKATHSSILAWRIPWTVESMGSQRVGQDWVTFTFYLFTVGLGGRSMGEERGESRKGEEMGKRSRTLLDYEENCTLIYVKHWKQRCLKRYWHYHSFMQPA